MTCGSWSVAVHISKYHVTLKITHVPGIVLKTEEICTKENKVKK